MKKEFLSRVRGDSYYPFFRGFVDIATGIGYIVAMVIIALGLGVQTGGVNLLAIVLGVFLGVVVAVTREISMMLADIADVQVDAANDADKARQTTT